MLLELLLVVLVLAVTVVLVTAPLRSGRSVEAREESDVADLEVARELKLREIRDAELDFRTGKLSPEDYRVLDRQLRAEAVEILHGIDRARGTGPVAD